MSDVPSIRVAGIHKSFGPLEVLRGVSFDVPRGSVVSVIGASGSGKSTLLRCVNYLEPPNAGEIYIEGEPLGARIDARGNRKARSLTEINAMRRELGVVFQQFNLWPHMMLYRLHKAVGDSALVTVYDGANLACQNYPSHRCYDEYMPG